MKTCPLCGERDHDGHCYAEMREEWKEQERDRWMEFHGFKVLKRAEDEKLIGWSRTLFLQKSG